VFIIYIIAELERLRISLI